MARFTLSEEVPSTPFYYYDLELLNKTLDLALFEASKHNYTIHYALKANVEPRILRLIADKGFGADCVSGWEVQAAIESGFSVDKIVFAGVGKSDSEIVYALEQDISTFNCESLEEIEIINSFAAKQGKVANIALRINPDVKPDTHKHISTGHGVSKFGIAYTEIDNQTIVRLKSLESVNITGLHFHIGSQILGLNFFEELAVRAAELCLLFESRGLPLANLNMGGGLGIDYNNPDEALIPDFKAYFDAFAKHLPTSKHIHFELGRSLVAQCGELITKVLFTKQTVGEETYIIIDAGMTELIRPALYAASHKIESLSNPEGEVVRCNIGGPICESSDVFATNIMFPSTKRGDILTIRSVGAYGSVMKSRYNLRPEAISYFDNNR